MGFDDGEAEQLLSEAAAARRAGDVKKAVCLLWASIADKPANISGYVNLLGLTTFDSETVPWRLLFGATRMCAGAEPVVWKNLAIANIAKGRLDQAHTSYRRALVLEPGHASLLVPFSKGPTAKPCALHWAYVTEPNKETQLRVVAHELLYGDPYLARRILEDGGRPSPISPTEVVLHWAKVLSRTGDRGQAIGLLERASVHSPLNTWLHYDLALLYSSGEWNDRVVSPARRSILVTPSFDPGYALLGRFFAENNGCEKSVKLFSKAIQVSKNPENSYFENLAAALVQLRNVEPAINLMRPLIVQNPANVNLLNNYAVASHYAAKFVTASRYASWCLVAHPNFADAYSNLGLVARMRGDVESAELAFSKAIELSNGRPFDIYNRGIFRLAESDPVQGARDYNARWEIDGFSTSRDLLPEPSLPLPVWDGQVQLDSILALWGEQGVGDETWFSSFIEGIRGRVGEIRLEVTPHLVSLFERSFPEILVFARGGEETETAMRSADIQCPIGNLLMILGASCNKPGYLTTDIRRVVDLQQRYRQGQSNRRLVGISWRSVKPGRSDRSFEAPLSQWQAIFDLADTVFVSLQYGDVAEDLRLVEEQFGINLVADQEIDGRVDMDSFAAQVAAMDAVVSVANSTVAVAHGLGKPTYVALQLLQEDWRYSRSRTTSRWLPTVRQAWQTKRDDWAPVLETLANQLAEEIPVPHQNGPSMD